MFTDDYFKWSLLDSNFKRDKSPHKYAILWASKFYQNVNALMRGYTFDRQLEKYPHGVAYIKHFLGYFDEYGVDKNKVKNEVRFLFRGIDKRDIKDVCVDNGFMSTTMSSHIAKKFAGRSGGNIIRFKTQDLQEDIKLVIIDQKLAPYLFEDEVLFPPGTILQKRHDKYTYKRNDTLIKQYMDHVIKVKLGGAPPLSRDIDLRNKLIVWYRAIEDRPVEILGQMFTPPRHKDVENMLRDDVLPYDRSLQNMTMLIPEVQDILAKTRDPKYNDDPEVDHLAERLETFTVYMAVYNMKLKACDTHHLGLFNHIYKGPRTQEIEDCIQSTYKETVPRMFQLSSYFQKDTVNKKHNKKHHNF